MSMKVTEQNVFYLRYGSLADIISCVEYDKTGDFLATGDHGGRIVIFKRENEVSYKVDNL